MTNLREYVVIKQSKLKAFKGETADTAGLIIAGGKVIMARNADEAEEVYVVEHGGSINDLVSFPAWMTNDKR